MYMSEWEKGSHTQKARSGGIKFWLYHVRVFVSWYYKKQRSKQQNPNIPLKLQAGHADKTAV